MILHAANKYELSPAAKYRRLRDPILPETVQILAKLYSEKEEQ